MNHLRIQNALSAYLDNELNASMHKQVEMHLQSCQECADMLAAFPAKQQQNQRFRASRPTAERHGNGTDTRTTSRRFIRLF